MKTIFTTLFAFAIVINVNSQHLGKIVFKTSKPSIVTNPNSKIGIAVNASPEDQSAVWVDADNNQVRDNLSENPNGFGSWEIKDYPVGSQTMAIHGNITDLRIEWGELVAVDFSQSSLKLTTISLKINGITGENATSLVKSLPDRTGEIQGKISIIDLSNSNEANTLTVSDVAIATAKNWAVVGWDGSGEVDYHGIQPTINGKISFTTQKPTTADDSNSKIGIGISALVSDQAGIWIDANNNQIRDEQTEIPQSFQLWNLTIFPVASQIMTIHGNITELTIKWGDVSSMDFSGSNLKLKKIEVFANKIKGDNATKLMTSLPDRTGETAGTIIVTDEGYEWEENQFTTSDVSIAQSKNWNVLAKDLTGNEVTYSGITTDIRLGNKANIAFRIDGNTLFINNLDSYHPVSLFNSLGQQVYQNMSTSSMQITIPRGMYILKIANQVYKIQI